MLSNISPKSGKKFSLQLGQLAQAKDAPYLEVKAPADAVITVNNPLSNIKVLVMGEILNTISFLLINSKQILSTI